MKKSLKITRDQKELNPEQLEEAKKYAQREIKKHLSTKRVSKKLVNSYVMNAYKVAGQKLPKKIRWFKSPLESSKHWASVGDSVMASVGASVWDSIGASVWASVGDSVWDSVWASVRDSVGASVWDSVGAYYDANINSYYGFFNEYFEKNKIVWLLKLSENTTGYYFYKNECWIVDKPKTLDLDEQGRLHSVKGKAIEWKDGYGFYFIHGVRFDEKLWKKVIKKGVHSKTVMSIENMEQRMAVLKLHGVEKIIKGAELLDKSNRGNELYLVKGVFSQDALFLKYSCPSTGRVYISGVDPSLPHDADTCMAWKFNISKEDYLKLEVES